ncbi:N-acetylglucosamine-6-sulfatase [Papilio machaon]|uniref:N-acetylglucosamine-6-sulfatase n=1 Tax=Papilio machaon TaxID=76193 RepID=A0A194R227_PAPMA|nr:N-acetylglucosamine-6-sulfatase [Papilio machaon]
MIKYLFMLVISSVVCEDAIRPNFLIILTDDQDSTLGGMNPMKNVQRFIGDKGVTFKNAYVTSPICCPSRASFLTGLYVHNHLTVNNSLSGGCYSRIWKNIESRTFATTLSDAGYKTFYAGKYLNEYGVKAAGGPEQIPPGWSEWHGLVGNSVYYNYTISNNGVPTHSTDLYLTDIIRDLSISYIENQTGSEPFLMVLAPPAPHQPFTPAPRHKGVFANVTAHRAPNFNIAVKDRHWLLSMPPSPLPDNMLSELDRVYRSRWEALLSVDELVSDVIEALDTNSLLEHTYVIYTSDNGYHMGQYSQMYDKRQPYESDIKVPLIIKGPGIEENTTSDLPVINIDLAPTIISLAGLQPSRIMDGRPIELIGNKTKTERTMLVEYYGEAKDGTVDPDCPWSYDKDNLAQCYPEYACKCQDARNNTFGCLRHIAKRINMKYCLFADNQSFTEMYDLFTDPYELTNIAQQVLPSVRHWYKLTLARMLACRGSDHCDHPLETPRIVF